MNKQLARFLGAAALAACTLALAQTSVRPGQYQMTVEMQMPGTPQPMTTTLMDCISPDEAANFVELMREEMVSVEGCTLSEPSVAGSKISWDTTCAGVSAKSELTFTDDGFTGTVRSVVDGKVIIANMQARRLSATCNAESD
jgi:hypothetical protein